MRPSRYWPLNVSQYFRFREDHMYNAEILKTRKKIVKGSGSESKILREKEITVFDLLLIWESD